ncbi:MAG: hypothetical protein LBF36_00025 [Mycoplasmataceae bacterium]|jgi:hypothetical protein|nr:hypothetical protein [Mycoplasmataceae bacterium]
MIQIIVKIDANEFVNEESAIKFVKHLFAIKTIKQMNGLERALEEVKNFKRSNAISLEAVLERVGN